MTITKKVETKSDGSRRITETIRHPDGSVESNTYEKLGDGRDTGSVRTQAGSHIDDSGYGFDEDFDDFDW